MICLHNNKIKKLSFILIVLELSLFFGLFLSRNILYYNVILGISALNGIIGIYLYKEISIPKRLVLIILFSLMLYLLVVVVTDGVILPIVSFIPRIALTIILFEVVVNGIRYKKYNVLNSILGLLILIYLPVSFIHSSVIYKTVFLSGLIIVLCVLCFKSKNCERIVYGSFLTFFLFNLFNILL